MTATQRLDKHHKEIAAIRALIREGKRLGVETRKDMRVMRAAQKRTGQKLRQLIEVLRAGRSPLM